jgi:multicomponent K+:H+ antiporter subunit A
MLPVLAMLGSAFSVAYSLRFIHGVFFGPDPVGLPRTPHEPPAWMRLPVEILVLTCIVVGILPAATVGPILALAAHSVLGDATPQYSLAIWHGFTTPLAMSVIATAGGVALYLALQRRMRSDVEGAPLIRLLDGRRMFERTMVFVSWRLAREAEAFLGARRLQPQLRLLVCVAALAGLLAVYLRGPGPGNLAPSPVDLAFALVWIVGAGCAVGAAWYAKFHRLATLILLGGAGLVVCSTFVWLSAPDLALTQLLVEVVTTVLLLLGLRWLPKRLRRPGRRGPEAMTATRRAGDLAIAGVAGTGLAALAYAVMTRTPPELLAQDFLERAYFEGGGTNVVNVILVDFRSFDTLGEITVLGAVALTVYALLRRFRPAPDSIEVPKQQREQSAAEAARPDRREGPAVADWLLVPSIISRLVFPVIGLVAVYLLLRGHDLPGGGFVAGLTMSIAIILQYMIGGANWIEAHLRVLPLRWMSVGLLLAAGTGVASWLFGYPFLTSYFTHLELPGIGELPIASALLFDIGVFALVVGATVLMLIALAHQSVRGQRAAPRSAADPAAPHPVALAGED